MEDARPAPLNDDPSARVELNVLWTKVYPIVFTFIRSCVTDFHDSEDIMQEVATAAAERFDQYDRSRPFSAWVIGIARNKILMHFRLRAKDRHLFNDEVLSAIAAACIDIEPEIPKRRQALEQCYDRISGKSRKVLDMRYARGDGPKKIAAVTGMTPNAVSIFLHRIRKVLRECIESQLHGHGGGARQEQGGNS